MCYYSIEHLRKLRKYALKHKFSLPAGFKRRSYKRLQPVYNGVGAEWMPRLIRRIITWLLRRLEPAAFVHDYEWSLVKKSFKHFLSTNLRLWRNAAKSRRFFVGGAAAILCTLFGWKAYLNGKENVA